MKSMYPITVFPHEEDGVVVITNLTPNTAETGTVGHEIPVHPDQVPTLIKWLNDACQELKSGGK